jgi:undecaprenyl-diphosphatase
MTLIEAIVLGIVQGLTEFFPVSSSGHLVMTEELLGLSLPGVAFDVALHVATLVSVIIVYRQRLMGFVRGAARRETWSYLGRLVLATIPAAVVGVLFKDWFEARFDDPVFAGTMLLVTGCIVWSSRWALAAERVRTIEVLPLAFVLIVAVLAGTTIPLLAVLTIAAVIMTVARVTAAQTEPEPSWMTAVAMGVAQAAAILPGISRSGSTVLAGLWRRLDPVAAAEFSFLMSIPAILGAAVLSLPDLAAEGATVPAPQLISGALAAGIAGVAAIRFFVSMLRRRSFHVFAWYCWVVGALFLLTR